MRQVRFLSAAEWELIQAARYYESEVPALGAGFLSEVQKAVAGIESHPQAASVVKEKIRRRIPGRFPYAIVYRVEPDEIIILAMIHLHRSPDYWHGRK
jgi:toxin ParE1/3/4